MKQLKKYIIAGIIFVLIAGTLAHFLYEWTRNNFVIGLITPVNDFIGNNFDSVLFLYLHQYFGEKYICFRCRYLCFKHYNCILFSL